MMTIEQALAYWVREKHLTKKKALELVDSLPPGLVDREQEAEHSHRAIGIFAAVGAVLVGLGVMLFVASNWSAMTPFVKVLVLVAAMLATGIAGYVLAFERRYVRTGTALLFVNALIYGATIFLVAQIYHLPLNFWLGGLLWFVGVSLFAVILQSRLHTWLAVPLLLVTLGWLRTADIMGSGEFDFFFDAERSIVNLFPALGVALVSAGILHRRSTFMNFASKTLFHWGVFLTVLTFVISTFHRDIFYQILFLAGDTVGLLVMGAAVVLLIVAIMYGKFETHQGRWGLLAYGLYTAFTFLLARAPVFLGLLGTNSFTGAPQYLETATNDILMLRLFFVLHVILFFIFLLTLVWYGTLLRMPAVINIGMLGIALTVIVQYFSWAWASLDKSVVFILGGIIILALSFILERQRKRLLASIEHA